MNQELFTPAIIGAVSGSIGVLVAVWLLQSKNWKIGDGLKIGLNLSSDLKCPACGDPFPALRRPKNFRQVMWGGWTCEKCGSEFDKWLKPVEPKEK